MMAEHYVANGHVWHAYQAAGYSVQGSDRTQRRRADEIIKRPNVQAYIAKLRSKAAKKAVLSRARALELLAEIAEGETPKTRDASHSDRIRAMERASKMQGWDKPDRLQVDGLEINLNTSPSRRRAIQKHHQEPTR